MDAYVHTKTAQGVHSSLVPNVHQEETAKQTGGLVQATPWTSENQLSGKKPDAHSKHCVTPFTWCSKPGNTNLWGQQLRVWLRKGCRDWSERGMREFSERIENALYLEWTNGCMGVYNRENPSNWWFKTCALPGR